MPTILRSSDFEQDLRGLTDRYVTIWESLAAAPPAEVHSEEEQRSCEVRAGLLISAIEECARNGTDAEGVSCGNGRLFRSLRELGTGILGIPDVLFSKECLDATRSFVPEAQRFDRRITPAALSQGLRNVWVMTCLQLLLGRRPAISPSVFAYSMLYPYTDNHLDQPGASAVEKERSCRRLGARLCGTMIEPSDEREVLVFRLIEMIEREFPRNLFPDVHSSLLAIHLAQWESVFQQGAFPPTEREALRISVAKGGASVLADGWLISGRLEEDEADFIFGLGVMLQLLDDLQDTIEDSAAGRTTLFTRAAQAGPLDLIAERLRAFITRVLDAGRRPATTETLRIRQTIGRSCRLLIVRAAAESPSLFSEGYLVRAERASPVRLDFIRSRGAEARRLLKRNIGKIGDTALSLGA